MRKSRAICSAIYISLLYIFFAGAAFSMDLGPEKFGNWEVLGLYDYKTFGATLRHANNAGQALIISMSSNGTNMVSVVDYINPNTKFDLSTIDGIIQVDNYRQYRASFTAFKHSGNKYTLACIYVRNDVIMDAINGANFSIIIPQIGKQFIFSLYGFRDAFNCSRKWYESLK